MPWWEEGSLRTEATVRGGVGVRDAHGVAGLVLPRSTFSGYWYHTPTCTRWASHTSDYLCGWWLWQLTVPGPQVPRLCSISHRPPAM